MIYVFIKCFHSLFRRFLVFFIEYNNAQKKFLKEVEEKLYRSKIYINKTETQQHQFLEKYPEFDGRGLKIAIIDGGMDVSSPGLQKTSTGLPKIIDCFEFTSEGSVDTSTIIKKLDENNSLIGLSGRQLKIPMKWKNPSSEWHLGIKSVFELCHNRHISQKLKKKLRTIMLKHEILNKKNNGDKEKLNEEEELIDCIVWNDGDRWCAYLITSATFNDLENAEVITNFRDCFEYCFLIDKITCCITISDDGNQLQICTSTASHATKVAHIAASHFPGNEQSDGLAPGAQIYFMEVVTGKKTVFSYERALAKCLELGVDIINISLKFRWADIYTERLQLLDEMQSKHGTIVVQGAGNQGPLFSTMSETSTDHIFFIGSMITSEINEKIYKMRGPNFPSATLKSSRGPSRNNYSRGISFVAPGEVIVPCAQWISKEPQLSSAATSYATPNVTGSIACLLSALKANSIPYTPAMIKFALSNTAIPLKNCEKLESGDGIIQIDAAFEFLKNFSKIIPRNYLDLSIKDSKMKGIYLIVTEKTEIQKYSINVKHFEAQTDEHIPWILLSDKNQCFIKHSKTAENGTFDVEISTEHLKKSKLYYSEIHGFHPGHSVTGSFFFLPITIIVPKIIENNIFETPLIIQSNVRSHFYLRPPLEGSKCSFQFWFSINKEYIVLQNEIIEKGDSEKPNKIRVFEFKHEYCNISIRWRGELFEICFYKWENKNEIKICKFEAKFE